ncbi:MAG: class I SAM-dependent methyltransferase [Gemmatimonadetes bacterium]|nr:class I SAM-dependent methyltransferase [Gemmatimonadota bacterium]
MRIDHADPRRNFVAAHAGKASRHAVADRVDPSPWQYDYPVLRALRDDVEGLLRLAPARASGAMALDVGSLRSPYKAILTSLGYDVRTLDLTTDDGADFAGTAEATGRPDASVDLVLCTQVLEHVRTPWVAMREFHRILRPGGQLLITIPHVWFYHPHPGDYWRVTQEGIVALCDDAGFRVLEARTQGGAMLCFGQVVNFLAYGVLGAAGAPLYRASNAVFGAMDRLVPNELFALNMACLAERPA